MNILSRSAKNNAHYLSNGCYETDYKDNTTNNEMKRICIPKVVLTVFVWINAECSKHNSPWHIKKPMFFRCFFTFIRQGIYALALVLIRLRCLSIYLKEIEVIVSKGPKTDKNNITVIRYASIKLTSNFPAFCTRNTFTWFNAPHLTRHLQRS